MTKTELISELNSIIAHSTGTEEYHPHYFYKIYPLVYTDGVNNVANAAGGYWVIDAIASYRRKEAFQLWELKTSEGKGVLTMTDGENDKTIVRQRIPFTDFPLPHIKFYVVAAEDPDGNKNFVLMLPNEY